MWFSILVSIVCFVFFFFKQKTAYEMRISDWSSDVCSSDLPSACVLRNLPGADGAVVFSWIDRRPADGLADRRQGAQGAVLALLRPAGAEIGRASCRERVCQYV